MSTTVSYKGSTLTTVDNQTRTLLTKGKYLEDNVTLTDVSGGSANLQSKTAVPSTAVQTVIADTGYDALSSVEIAAIPSQYIIPAGEIAITSNGSVDVSAYATASVSVAQSSAPKVIITGSGLESWCYIQYNNIKYYEAGEFEFTPGDTLLLYANGRNYGGEICINTDILLSGGGSAISYQITLQDCDIKISLSGAQSGSYISATIPVITSGTYSVTSAGTKNIWQYNKVAIPSGTATTPTTTVSVTPTISVNSSGQISVSVSSSSSITPTVSTGYISAGAAGTISVSGSSSSQLTTQAAVTITPSESQQTAVASGKYTTGNVVVAAISANYVGSGVTQRSSADLTASGSVITAPAGYYASSVSKSIAAGTEGTPTATKGTVSNHQISITPSVTNTAGYISGSTKTGTAATVSATELVSGTYNFSNSGTVDVTNYASAAVSAGSAGTPVATKGTVSNHSITVTPSVTNSSGWITGETKTGTAATVSAAELVSGTLNITSNGNYDVAVYSAATVSVEGGGSGTGEIHQDVNGYVIFSNEGETGLDMNREVTISNSGAVTQALEAGKIYHFTGTLTSLTLTLTSTDMLAHYHFDFLSGSSAPTLNLPSNVKLPDDFQVVSNYRYEIDILNNYGTVGTWAN